MDLPEWKLNNSIRSMLCCKRYASALMRYGGYFDVDAKAARLEALNTELEDPNVWNSSERAQALGKEKKGLENTVLTLTALDADTRDARELFDLARADADEAMLTSSAQKRGRWICASQKSNSAVCSINPPIPIIVLSIFRRVRAAPKRATGRQCCLDCIYAIVSAKGFRRLCLRKRQARWRVSSAPRSRWKANMHTARCALKRASIAWCVNRPSIRAAAGIRRLHQYLSIPKLTMQSASRSIPLICALILFAPPAQAGSMSTRPIRRSG